MSVLDVWSNPLSPLSTIDSDYSSPHEDRSCRAGLNTPSKADALCDIPPRAPRLCVHQTGSRGGAEARRWEAQRKRASRATRQTRQGSMYLRTAIFTQRPSFWSPRWDDSGSIQPQFIGFNLCEHCDKRPPLPSLPPCHSDAVERCMPLAVQPHNLLHK